MQFRKIGLPIVISSLIGFVFMGPQQANSQAPAPRAEPIGQDTLTPSPSLVIQSGIEDNPYIAQSNDPELAKLHMQEGQVENDVRTLLAQYGRTDKEGERSTIKKKLTEKLASQFDLQQKRREAEVARIEAQVTKLRKLIKNRTDSRQTIIDKRLDQILMDADGLGWSSSPSGFSLYRSDFAPHSIPAVESAAR